MSDGTAGGSPPGGDARGGDAPVEKAAYTTAEEQLVKKAYAADGQARCPRCGAAMTARAIGGGSFGLGYARRREWLICSGCRRSVIFDLRRGTRL